MDNDNPVHAWYANLTNPTSDDKADFEVMLMDKNNTRDAQLAVTGLIQNLLMNGYREPVFRLLISGARKENALNVKAKALAAIIFIAATFDEQMRQSQALQEDLLDMLEEQHNEALLAMNQYAQIRKHMIIMGKPQKPLRQTLIFSLIVLGNEELRLFD
ncbi:MAG: hypothetical protein J6Y00_02035 [Paludibacteraceae bacterium]|nr:hypothetical protein [Paludibacteraceae bacterium]